MLSRWGVPFGVGLCSGVVGVLLVSLFAVMPDGSKSRPVPGVNYRVAVFSWCDEKAKQLVGSAGPDIAAQLVPVLTPYGSPPILSIAEVAAEAVSRPAALELAESIMDVCTRNTYSEIQGVSIAEAVARFEMSPRSPKDVEQLIVVKDKSRDVVRIFSVPPIDPNNYGVPALPEQ